MFLFWKKKKKYKVHPRGKIPEFTKEQLMSMMYKNHFHDGLLGKSVCSIGTEGTMNGTEVEELSLGTCSSVESGGWYTNSSFRTDSNLSSSLRRVSSEGSLIKYGSGFSFNSSRRRSLSDSSLKQRGNGRGGGGLKISSFFKGIFVRFFRKGRKNDE